MKALVYQGPRDIQFADVPDPEPERDTDAIVKVSLCAICGSDLHIYHGQGFSEDFGFCVGHEAVGEVVEVGKGVRRLRVGDQVMVSAAVGCGDCARCLSGQPDLCLKGMMGCYGLSHRLQGAQAEALRVPMADFNAQPIPEGVTSSQALMLTDSLATAWFGCRNAGIRPGGTVAVIGLGPIGLMAVECAFAMGASTVFALDLVAERRAIAGSMGAIAVKADPVGSIRELTKGQGVDSVVEAVGADATIQLAIQLVGRGGRVSVVGVNQTPEFPFPMGLAFMKGVTFAIGTCGVPRYWPALVPLIQSGRLRPERFISHVLPLGEGPRAYEIFDAREDGALKMVLRP